MTDKIKEALEALESVLCDPEGNVCWQGSYADRDIIGDALQTFREALAEQPAQQQEPQPPYEFERYVAGSLRAQGVRVERATTLADAMRIAAKICPLANPPSAPTVLVYTSPPASKPWVGLTDEEIDEAQDSAEESFYAMNKGLKPRPLSERASYFDWHLARAIEAKLNGKNA